MAERILILVFSVTGIPSRREKILVRCVVVVACCVGVAAWALHDSTEWVHVLQVSAHDPSATKVILQLNACEPDAPITVTETNTDVRVVVNRRWDPSGSNKLCLTGLEINLKTPIGNRRVADAHGSSNVRVEFASAPAPPAAITGSVSEVIGMEAFGTVTGWLVITPTDAILCDTLSADSDSCASDSIHVDFFYASQAKPTDLTTHGSVQVSNSVVTLTGSLKVDTLYVGVTQ